MRLILASQSPARKLLMKKLGVPFECHTSGYEEDMTRYKSPSRLAQFLALEKALFVAKKFPKSMIIGADTFGVLKGEKLGKPKNSTDARRMIQKTSGQKMSIYTGVAIVQTDAAGNVQKKLCSCEKTVVQFKTMQNADIQHIMATDDVLNTAGAFSIEGAAGKFVTAIHGDYDSVIGLPVTLLKTMLNQVTIEKNGFPI